MRRVVLLAALALLPARAARATEVAPPAGTQNQLTVDLGAASVGVTHAWRTSRRFMLFGGGGGMGLSPLVGTIVTTGTHFDPAPNINLLEVVHAQLFLRFELAPWLRADTGVRAGAFIHGGENYSGGPFATVFVAPALAWRWLWVGPRVSAGMLWERGGPSAGALIFDYVMLRLVTSW
jgi:hypothetical protein